ncbi:hypothetical protein [Algoriphagus machipongonensis]|uniref:Uncharacterized protein n=1 Tax=Algoriphagus machipongonensis TaxID=388413 RepID=A3HYK7_9BACT|nr:hypothetical protein [Algoriphagus machipongonensis]EAZ80343.1 hypothetical protein ALPR1_05455 [Algoriphagus machipongonensis]
MTDREFDLMDELYFVQPFQYLQETLGWEEKVILESLESLYKRGLIKCLKSPDEECFYQVNIQEEGSKLYFLATKKGLMAHNTI